MNHLKQKYERDKRTWDECAETYERQIVGGHPDILAFEEFEEDFLDRILRHLAQKCKRPVKLMDIGCGSGRLHLRYGAKTQNTAGLGPDHPLVALKNNATKFVYDPLIASSLAEVWGIDFSAKMIDLAKEKLQKVGLKDHKTALSFARGSAFELAEESAANLPIAICLVNSIGVMQGVEGAKELFKSMRKSVEAAAGIAIISCYRQEYMQSYALGQYESTMDVSGQPVWMRPDTYASPRYKQVPRYYKLAHSRDDKLVVDVYDQKNNLVKKDHVLVRDPGKTEEILGSGDILTYSDYKSHWYSFDHLDRFINDHWQPGHSYHIKTQDLDMIRAEPAQMAVFDPGGYLEDIFQSWNVAP